MESSLNHPGATQKFIYIKISRHHTIRARTRKRVGEEIELIISGVCLYRRHLLFSFCNIFFSVRTIALGSQNVTEELGIFKITKLNYASRTEIMRCSVKFLDNEMCLCFHYIMIYNIIVSCEYENGFWVTIIKITCVSYS